MMRQNVIECYACHEETPLTFKVSELMTHYPLVDLIQLKKLRDELRSGPKEVACVNCSFGKDNTPAVFYCCDCKEIMCRHDSVAHDRFKPTHRSVTIDRLLNETHMEKLLSDLATVKCKTHPTHDIKYYCVECDDQICDDCGFGDHNTHKKTFLKAALNLFCESVDQKMDELGKPGIAMLQENDKYDNQVRQMMAKQQVTIERINKHFESLAEILEKRRETLIQHVNSLYISVRKQLYTACQKQSSLLKKISSLADFVANYREYPNNYKIELTSIITKRFNSLKSSMPKIPFQIKAIEYDKGNESEVDEQLNNIGWIKYLHKTSFESPIKHISRSELLPTNIPDKKETEASVIDLQGIAQADNDRLYMFSSQYTENEANNKYGKDTCQIFDSQFNSIDMITYPCVMQNTTQILIGIDNYIYILERGLKHIIIRDDTLKRTIRCISADDINSIQDPSSIALTSNSRLVVHNKSMNELVLLDKDFLVDKRFALKPLSLKRKESPQSVSSRTESGQKAGARAKKPNVAAEREPKTPEPFVLGSITIAINSRDNIFVVSEDRALITVYSLEGKEIGEINFQDRVRLVEDHSHEKKTIISEVEPGVKEKVLSRKPTTTTTIGASRQPTSTPQKRSLTPKASKISETIIPTTFHSPSKTLITIDVLDNIYVIQKNWILMFDPQHKFSGASKLGFEPMSLVVNKSGHVYIMSDKGEMNVYS
ncbi:E3 ubiquitin-protein ligase TRIM71 [Oopsacas minuta]|uniref:E3 ubiquitin-protein ligase TRIM71 n=1 Tax=Oopsacas minuta TaxID=111878 RepID=A0AAV7KA64_9METZ|nr:E3 ubiquitin-protein ligase TRIM71 [Oopsacas minuta]